MITRNIKQMIFLAALILSVVLGCKEPEIKHTVYNGTQKSTILNNILSRRAIRKYKDTQVSKEQIDTIMRAAIFAPSALNKQPWQLRVVQNPKILEEVNKRFLAYAKGKTLTGSSAHYREPGFSVFHNSPTLIVIASDKSNQSAKMDVGIALQNILLSANAIGLGTCPLGMLSFVLDMPENGDIKKLLNIPDDYTIAICSSLGYPAENPAAPIRYAEKVKIIE